MIHVWRTIDNLWKSVLSFHHVGSRELHQTWQQAPLPTEHPNSSEVVTDFFEPSEGVLRLRVLHASLYEGVGAVPDTAPHSSNPAWFRSWDAS